MNDYKKIKKYMSLNFAGYETATKLAEAAIWDLEIDDEEMAFELAIEFIDAE